MTTERGLDWTTEEMDVRWYRAHRYLRRAGYRQRDYPARTLFGWLVHYLRQGERYEHAREVATYRDRRGRNAGSAGMDVAGS